MARNIRWFVSFKAFDGTSCRVNIYDNDWPADTIISVAGAANPFVFEEFLDKMVEDKMISLKENIKNVSALFQSDVTNFSYPSSICEVWEQRVLFYGHTVPKLVQADDSINDDVKAIIK